MGIAYRNANNVAYDFKKKKYWPQKDKTYNWLKYIITFFFYSLVILAGSPPPNFGNFGLKFLGFFGYWKLGGEGGRGRGQREERNQFYAESSIFYTMYKNLSSNLL